MGADKQYNGRPGVNFDSVTLTGGALQIGNANSTLTFGNLVDWSSSFWTSNQTWNVFTGASSVSLGNFGIVLDGNVGGYSPSMGSFSWVTSGSTGVNLVYTANVTAVPEPTSLAFGLLGAGIGLLVRSRRRPKAEVKTRGAHTPSECP